MGELFLDQLITAELDGFEGEPLQIKDAIAGEYEVLTETSYIDFQFDHEEIARVARDGDDALVYLDDGSVIRLVDYFLVFDDVILANLGFVPALAAASGGASAAAASGAALLTGAAIADGNGEAGPNDPTVDGLFSTTPYPLITGTATPGSTVSVTAGGAIYEVIATPSGTWSVNTGTAAPVTGTFTPLLEGANPVDVTSVDPSGNTTSGTGEITLDSIPPTAPIVDPTDGTMISGTGEPGATITVTYGSPEQTLTTTVDSSGNWSIEPPVEVPNGTILFVHQVDPAGNQSPTVAEAVDGVAPSAPVVDPTDGTLITGRGEPGATVTVSAGGQTLTALVDPAGNWSVDPEPDLAGATLITATQADPVGNLSDPTTQVVDTALTAPTVVDVISPEVPVIDPTNGTEVAGSGEPGATVTITSTDPVLTLTAVVDATGNWSVDPSQLPTGGLADGSVLTATQADPSGNESDPSTTTVDGTAPSTPTIDPTNGAPITGSGEPGATVVVSVGGQAYTTTVDPTGNWSVDPSPVPENGTLVTATQTDPVGNTSDPATSLVDSTVVTPPDLYPTNGQSITGTGEPGATVTVNAAGQTLTATVDPNGNWSVDPEPDLGDGETIIATQNVNGTDSALQIGSVDATPPGAPVINTTDGTTLSGTGEPGATVAVSYGSPEQTLYAVVDPTGAWSTTPNPPISGGTALEAVQVDPAGNQSDPANGDVLNGSLPAPTIDPSNGQLVEGTGEPGAIIAVSYGSPEVVLTTTVDPNGNWSVNLVPNALDGTTIEATQSLSNGTISDPATGIVSTDIMPVSFVDEPTGGDLYGSNDAVRIELDAGQVVNVAGGTPTIELVIGTETVLAQLVSGSGTDTLVFEYIIEPGDEDVDGIKVVAGSLALNGATITDSGAAPVEAVNGSATSAADVFGASPAVISLGGSEEPAFDDKALGASVGAGGDINGDGFQDFIIGTPSRDNSIAGRAFVVFGGPTAKNVDLADLNPEDGFEILGNDANVGTHVSGLGDVNGDGLADIFVSDSNGGTATDGSGVIVYGKAMGATVNVGDIQNGTSTDGTTIIQTSSGYYDRGFGANLTVLHDFNGDGFADFAIGSDSRTTSRREESNFLSVVFGGPGLGNPVDVVDIDGGEPGGFRIEGQFYTVVEGGISSNDNLGSGRMNYGGDVNGDGFSDLLAYASNASPIRSDGFFGAGDPMISRSDTFRALHVVFGGEDITDVNADDLIFETTDRGYSIINATSAFASVGDVNNDGLDDIAFAYGASIVVVYGRASVDNIDINDVAGDPTLGYQITGFDLGLVSIDSAGDFNGDGYVDFIAGHNSNEDEAVYIVYGQAPGSFDVSGIENGTANGYKITNLATDGPENDYNNDEVVADYVYDNGYVNGGLGTVVKSIGDINGDGFDDVKISMPGTTTHRYYYDYYGYGNGGDYVNSTETTAGTSYIIFGNAENLTDTIDIANKGDLSAPSLVADNVGTTGDDIIDGTSATELLVGNSSNDTITGNGGSDVILGATGDDIIVIDGSNITGLESGPMQDRVAHVDGGAGTDRLTLGDAGITLSFDLLDEGRIKGIEEIDVGGTGANALNISLNDILDLSETSNELRIFGDNDDTVTVTGMTGFVQSQETIGSTTFDVYTLGQARLMVEDDVAVVI